MSLPIAHALPPEHRHITPARLMWDDHPAPYAPDYGDRYWSHLDGLAESAHVFLQGLGLPERWWQGGPDHVLAELGFGSGLNFLLAAREFMARAPAGTRLHWVSFERHPPEREALSRLFPNSHPLSALAARLKSEWPPALPGPHRLWLTPRVSLTLVLGDARFWLPQLRFFADGWLLDGYAPDRNPELWEPQLLAQVAAHCRPAARVASFSVAGAVRQTLTDAGFSVQRRAGIGRKREVLTAELALGGTPARPRPASVAIIGAGLAGAALAAALSRRGVAVTVLEQAARPATGASGNPAGIVLPVLARDFNPLAQLTCLAFLHAVRGLRELDPVDYATLGVLRWPKTTAMAAQFERIASELQLPPEFARWVEGPEAAERAGMPLPPGLEPRAWWFPQGHWQRPTARVAAWLSQARSGGASLRLDSPVLALRTAPHGATLTLGDGQRLAAEMVVLAHGAEGASLWPQGLPLATVRGQISAMPTTHLPKAILCREGYALPMPHEHPSTLLFGASYRHDTPADLPPTEAEHAANLRLLGELLASPPALDAGALTGRVSARAVFPDRLPAVGGLPTRSGDDPSVHALLGLGSRGLTWAGLLAESLADALCDLPQPLPEGVRQAIAPSRFVERQRRRGQPDAEPPATWPLATLADTANRG